MKQVISTHQAPAAIGPYSQAIRVGNLLYTSGQIPINPATGNFVDGSIKDANLASGMTWNIGQDGSAAYRYNLQGDIDDFALWNRGMSIDELREIYKAGRQNHDIGTLLK